MWEHRKRAPSEGTEKRDTVGAECSVKKPVSTVPLEVLDTVFEFVDGNGLLSCETVSYRWRCAADRTSLWKRACVAAFPHLGDFQSPYVSCSAYEGDWRETFLDGNRGNRSTVLDWKMEAVAGAAGGDGEPDGDPDESQRRFFPPFSLCGYSFSLLADPRGNPRATNQAPAGGPRVEKGLSVYLTVLFQDDPPDTPPWGGGGAASTHGFPPPPLQLGPGHPWGAEEEEEKEEEHHDDEEEEEVEDQERGGSGEADKQGGGSAIPANGDGVSDEDGGGGGHAAAAAAAAAVGSTQESKGARETGKATAAIAAAATLKRDPHGLRRRRRRARTREGKAPVVSHVGDASAIARECCVGFSLTAVNKDRLKDVMWVSSMKRDRFFPGRSSWGVHCLVPTSTYQDPEEGFLQEGAATVRLRVRLLFLTAHVYTTADLASHRGFGMVPVRGNDQPLHFHGRPDGRQEPNHAGGSSNAPVTGPLPCLTFEVLRCTTLEEMERLVARALKVDSNEIRLWVITQPLTDAPLAPRQLLSGEDLPARAFDDGQTSPSLFRLLSGDTIDETCRVRLWVQQRSDGGFWEADATGTPHAPPFCQQQEPQPQPQPQVTKETSPAQSMTGTDGGACARGASGRRSGSGPSGPSPTPRVKFGGVKLPRVSDLPVEQMQQLSMFALGSGSSRSGSAPPGQVGGGGGAVEPASAAPADVENLGSESASGAAAANSDDAQTGGAPEELMLVFLKTVGLGNGGEEENAAAAPAPAASTSAAAGVTERSVSKDGNRGNGGTRITSGPGALPSYLTHAVLRGGNPLRSLFELTAELLQDGTAPEDLWAHVEDLPWAWQGAALKKTSDDSRTNRLSGGGPADGGCAQNGRKAQACRRFWACPPAVAARAVAADKQDQDDEIALTPTLEEAGLLSGASICFFRAGREAIARKTYGDIVEGLVKDMRLVLARKGPLGRVHLIKLPEVVEICESLGYQGFRARIAHDQQRHVNPRETLEYVAKGKHLAFICDSCGTQDFSGPRYHCLSCPDYDLCEKCNAKREPAPPHRYLFEQGQWRREGGFHGHADDHRLEEIFPMPADGCEWRRRQSP